MRYGLLVTQFLLVAVTQTSIFWIKHVMRVCSFLSTHFCFDFDTSSLILFHFSSSTYPFYLLSVSMQRLSTLFTRRLTYQLFRTLSVQYNKWSRTVQDHVKEIFYKNMKVLTQDQFKGYECINPKIFRY